jgi:hypothetical protein
MSAWSHSEWRLLHAYVPAYSGPARAPLSGKRNFKTRDEGTEAASLGREPINLPGETVARVRYAPIATKSATQRNPVTAACRNC